MVDLNDISRMKDKIESSGQSVIKLKRHMENGTCPPDLRYDAKTNIFLLDETLSLTLEPSERKAEQLSFTTFASTATRHNCEKPNLVIRIHRFNAGKSQSVSCNILKQPKKTSVGGRE